MSIVYGEAPEGIEQQTGPRGGQQFYESEGRQRMPEADAPSALAKRGGLPPALKQRIGPLPLWGWGVASLGILAGVLYIKHRGSLGSGATGAGLLSGGTPPAQTIGSGSAGGDTGTGGGSGTVVPSPTTTGDILHTYNNGSPPSGLPPVPPSAIGGYWWWNGTQWQIASPGTIGSPTPAPDYSYPVGNAPATPYPQPGQSQPPSSADTPPWGTVSGDTNTGGVWSNPRNPSRDASVVLH